VEAWWPLGHVIGYEHTFIYGVCDLLKAIAEDEMPEPSFVDGAKWQAVLEAVAQSAESRQWVAVEEV